MKPKPEIDGHYIDEKNHVIHIYSDGSTRDCGPMPVHSKAEIEARGDDVR